ncbi:DUF1127 domain-containing protein [Frigidibacter sp. MR17.14]|uniref:DUF1127 domain-containing protein n=1 Tax=Frigidibacter sp. MR17.14 TaxID=3126509 RepID=UPI003012C01C
MTTLPISTGNAKPRATTKGRNSGLVTVWQAWTARRRQRAALARLDMHLLKDIGVDARTVSDEVAKPFWID